MFLSPIVVLENLQNKERTFFFFFILLFLCVCVCVFDFHFSKPLKFVFWVYQMVIFNREKSILCLEKFWENDFAPLGLYVVF